MCLRGNWYRVTTDDERLQPIVNSVDQQKNIVFCSLKHGSPCRLVATYNHPPNLHGTTGPDLLTAGSEISCFRVSVLLNPDLSLIKGAPLSLCLSQVNADSLTQVFRLLPLLSLMSFTRS